MSGSNAPKAQTIYPTPLVAIHSLIEVQKMCKLSCATAQSFSDKPHRINETSQPFEIKNLVSSP